MSDDNVYANDPNDPVRIADGMALQSYTDRFDEDSPESINTAIVHPHAVLDTAYRRAEEMGFAGNDDSTFAAIMSMWTDGFMAGQRAMAAAVGLDLDADPLEDDPEG